MREPEFAAAAAPFTSSARHVFARDHSFARRPRELAHRQKSLRGRSPSSAASEAPRDSVMMAVGRAGKRRLWQR